MPKIRQIVSDLLEELGINELPIPVEKIAKSLDVDLRFEPFANEKEQISGMLFRDNGKVVMGVNSSEAPSRQRFTIAHELGHLKLHTDSMFVDKLSDVSVHFRNELSAKAIDKDEIDANKFAAELLMPEDMINAEFRKETSDLKSTFGFVSREELIERLAGKFEVSGQAMTFRLVNLGVMKFT